MHFLKKIIKCTFVFSVVILSCFLQMSYAISAQKAQCPEKFLGTYIIEGIYEGTECGDYCYSTIRKDNNEQLALMCGEEQADAIFGKGTGQRVTVTYEKQQFWNEYGADCMQTEVCKTAQIISQSAPSALTTNESEDGTSQTYNICITNSSGVTIHMLDCMTAEIKRLEASIIDEYAKMSAKLSPEKLDEFLTATNAWKKYRKDMSSFLYDSEGGTSSRIITSDWMVQETARFSKFLKQYNE